MNLDLVVALKHFLYDVANDEQFSPELRALAVKAGIHVETYQQNFAQTAYVSMLSVNNWLEQAQGEATDEDA